MANTKKRILAMVLALVLALSLLPVNAMAESASVSISGGDSGVQVGQTITLTASISNYDGDRTIYYRWSSKNAEIATVDNGAVTGRSAGNVEIKVEAGYYKSGSWKKQAEAKKTITVTAPTPPSVTISGANSVAANDTITLSAAAADTGLERWQTVYYYWTSSDETKATVNDYGVVAGVAPGEVTIQVEAGYYTDWGWTWNSLATASKTITVTAPSVDPGDQPAASEKALFYFVLPGKSNTSTTATDYMYAGDGSIKGYPKNSWDRLYLSDTEIRSNYIVDEPTEAEIRAGLRAAYPNTYNESWSYTISWTTINRAGSSVGYDYKLLSDGYSAIHVDGAISINQNGRSSYTYIVAMPDGSTLTNNSGYHDTNSTVEINSTVANSGTFTTDGYSYDAENSGMVFEGWYEDAGYTIPAANSYTVDGTKTFYARYVTPAPVTHTLTINYVGPSDGTFVAPQQYTNTFAEGDSYSVNSPAVTGYTPDRTIVSGSMGTSDVVETVTYTVNNYTVKWDTDGDGTVDDSENVAYGLTPSHADGSKAEDAQYTYTFIGWAPTIVKVTGDATYTAQFDKTAKSYNIYYHVDGQLTDTVPVAFGAAVTEKAAPTKEGHTFSGWDWDNATVAIESAPATMPAHDVNVYGTFTINSYNVSYTYTGAVPDGAAALLPAAIIGQNFGTTVTVAAAPKLLGYTFSGWSTTNATVVNDSFQMPDNAVAFTGSWTAKNDVSYTVNYLEQGTGKVLETAKTVTGQTFGTSVIETAATIAGYTLVGETTQSLTLDAYNKVVTFYYTQNFGPDQNNYPTLTINKVDAKDGASLGGAVFTLKKDGVTVTTLTATNGTVSYAFTAGGTYTLTETTAPTNYLPSETVWTIEVTQDGAMKVTGPENNVFTKVYNWLMSLTGNEDAGKEDYTIEGNTLTVKNTKESHDLTIHYVYADSSEAHADYTETLDVGASYNVESPVITGYTADKLTVSGDMGKANVEVTVTYTANKHNIIYKITGEYFATESFKVIPDVAYGTALTQITDDMAKEGYTFSSWTGLPTTMPDDDVTVSGSYAIIPYNIAYNLGGGTVDGTNPTTYNVESNDITLINPTREGHTFAGWTGTGLNAPTEPVTITKGSIGDRSYTATWTVNSKDVTYTYTGTEPAGAPAAPATESKAYGTPVTVANAPTLEGYTFSGWTTADATVENGSFTMPDKAVEFTGTWTANTHNITYKVDGNVVKTYPTVAFGTSLATGYGPDYTVSPGYTLSDWSSVLPATMPDDDVVLTATTSLIEYTITYTLNGGKVTGTNPTTYTFESEDITLINPTKEGHTFAGWTGTELTGATETVKITKGSTGNREYTATWTANSYDVTYTKGEHGTFADQKSTVMYGSATPKFEGETPTDAEYYFTGWDKEIAETVTDHVVYTAQWAKKGSIIITANSDNTKTYTGAEQTVSGFTVQAPADVTVDTTGITASGSGTDANSYDVTFGAYQPATMTIGGKVYDVTYVPGTLTINPVEIVLTAKGATRAYTGEALTNDGYDLTTGKFVGDDGIASVTTSGSQTNFGSSLNTITDYTLKTGTKESNYAIELKTGTLTVNRAAVTVKANDKTKAYGVDDPTFDATVTGTFGTDTVDYTLSRADGEDVKVGGYVITPDGAAVQGNYTVTYETGILTITAADLEDTTRFTVSQPTDVQYNGTEQKQPVTVTDTKSSLTATYGIEYTPAINAGEVTVTITGSGNYTGTVTRTYQITPAPVTVTAENKSMTVGGSVPTLTYTVSGMVNGESASDLIKANVATTATNSSAANEYPITVSGEATQGNYTVAYVPGTLTISAAPYTPPYTPPTTPPGETDIEDEDTPLAELPSALNSTDHFQYIYGYKDGTVRPNGKISRAEVTTIFYRLLLADVRDEIFTTTNSFSDVSLDMWYNKAASSMENGGYITGYSDGTFRGSKAITRAEFVAIAARFVGEAEGEVTFSDVSEDFWAYDYIATAVANGWIGGYNDGTFRPNQKITRGEAVTIINRMLGRGVSKDGLLDGVKVWPDCGESVWCYLDVMEATNDHLYEGSRPDEKWTSLTIEYTYDMDKYERPDKQ